MKSSTDFSRYSAVEKLRNGRSIEIRSIKMQDRDELLRVVGKTSGQSFYSRFFSPKRGFSEKEMGYYLDVDFVNHVALVAVLEEAGRPVIAGGGRFIVDGPGSAELAFWLDDAYQGQSIGSILMRHLAAIADRRGLDAFHADVLPANIAMIKVFEHSGLPVSMKRDPGIVHVTLQLHDGISESTGGKN